MKIVSFIFVLLFLEARASFLDDFRSAISSINNGFGKLIGDVVTDVKDTIYCTISAVEQVLVQNGLLDQRTLYNQRCKGIEKQQEPANFRDGHNRTVSQIRKHSVIHKHSTRRISHESVKKVNKTIIDINTNIIGSGLELRSVPTADETDRLSEIRKVLQQESENISQNVRNEIKKLKLGSKSPVESILEEIKFLNDLRQNSKNETEVNEISRILDKVTDNMHLEIDSQKITDNHKFAELKKVLFQNVPNNPKNINSTTGQKELLSKKPKDSKDVELNKNNKEDLNHEQRNHTQAQIQNTKSQDKSLFGLGLDSLASFFNLTSVSPDDISNAKKIITDSQHSDKVLSYFFKGQQSARGKH